MQSDFSTAVVRGGKPSTSCKKQQEYQRSDAPFQGDATTYSDFPPPVPGAKVPVQSKKKSKKNAETMQWTGGAQQTGTVQHTQHDATTELLPKVPICLTMPTAVDLTHVTQRYRGPVQSVSQSTYTRSWAGQPKPRTSYRVREHYSPNHNPFKGDSSNHTHFRAVSPWQQNALLREVDCRAAELSHLQQFGKGVKRASSFGTGPMCCDTTTRQHFQPWKAQQRVRWVLWPCISWSCRTACCSSSPSLLPEQAGRPSGAVLPAVA